MTDLKRFMPIDWKRHGTNFSNQTSSPRQPDQTGMSQNVGSALATASRKTGAHYDYLVKTASRESSFNPNAKARTSSAAGLFQFIESTWLQVLKEQGPSIGLGHYAKFIHKTSKGFDVANPEHKKTILNLRYDPAIAAKMAGALTNRNNEILRANIGRAPTNGELYIAHFLGPEGASRLIKKAWANPDASAANLFPSAARANKSIFYSNGKARSVTEVYHQLSRQFDNMAVSKSIPSAPQTNAPTIAKSQEVPIEPSKIFQGLFFEAASEHGNSQGFGTVERQTSAIGTANPVGRNIQKQMPLSLFTGQQAENNKPSQVTNAYEEQKAKAAKNSNFFVLLR